MFPYIEIFGRTIGMYGVLMALGIFLAGFLTIRYYKKLGQPSEDVFIVGAIGIGIAIICGNLLYIGVTYPFSYILSQIKAGDFSFLGSGIVFYGGLIGGVVGAFLGFRVARCQAKLFIEAAVPYIPLGHAVGRIGCLMAGCCYGMEYDGPLAVYYTRSLLDVSPDQGYFPVQPLEGAINIVICCVLLILRKRGRGETLLPMYLCMYSVSRFLLEFLRGDQHRGIYFGVSMSQWISLALFATGAVWVLLKTVLNRKCKTEENGPMSSCLPK